MPQPIAPDALTRRRQFMGMTVDDLAQALGVTSRAVRHWEAGTRSVGDQAFGRLLKVLKCDASEISVRRRGTETLTDLRRDAAMSTEDVAVALRNKDGGQSLHITAEKLRDLERGRRVRGWNWRSPEVSGLVAKSLADIYGVPDRVVLDAWRRSRPDDLPPLVPPSQPRQPSRSAMMVWRGLNARQRRYLICIFTEDQEAEQQQRSDRALGGRSRSAAEWRLMTLSLSAPAEFVGYTRLQHRLRDAGVHDPGAGSSVAALSRRALVLVHRDRVIIGGLGEVRRTRVEITRRGRSVVRTALEQPAASKAPPPLLSSWLWQIMIRVTRAGSEGVDGSLAGRGPHYLAVGQSPDGRLPSRGFIILRLPNGAKHGAHRWYLTEAGRRHVRDYLEVYRELYSDVDSTGLEEFLA